MLYDIERVTDDKAVAVESRTRKVVNTFSGGAMLMTVTTETDIGLAYDMLMQAKVLKEVIEDLTEPFREKAYNHYKDVQQAKKDLIEPIDTAVEHLREEVAAYYARQTARLSDVIENAGDLIDFSEIEPYESAIGFVGERFDIRQYHRAKVVDMEAFLKYVVDNDKYELVSPNLPALNSIARRMGDNIGIDGVEVYTKLTPVAKNEE